ncbi:FAD-dependent oxidoreductase [Liquorilactobacillus satsumensis]|uniref:FAD-dependent oxidoreductase n=1 Tax=Liquorilactobacillus satsumensis TaxID=259059 RepID=UPI0039EB87D5
MKVIIIGCTHAGLVAAQEILATHPETQLTIYERNNNFSFSTDGIFLSLNKQVKKLENVFVSSPDKIRKLGAVVRENHTVLRVDMERHQVRAVDMKKGKVLVDHYDKLIITTGANVRLPAIAGIDNRRVLLCKNYLQAKNVYEMTKANRRIAIVGAGYAGVELAESLTQNGNEVQLFQAQKRVLNNYFDPESADLAVKLLQEHGVTVHLNTHVKEFADAGATTIRVTTESGQFVEEMAIVCTGFIPNTKLFTGQLKMERHGALILNEYLQTSHPDVYAAGDCTAVYFNPLKQTIYAPFGTNAVRQGLLVARNVFGNCEPYMGTQSTSVLPLFGYHFATTGLTLETAKRAGLNALRADYKGIWRPPYMPKTDPVTVSLVYNRDNRKILGLQLHSKQDITQAVNTVSLAIQNNNTIDDLALVDMFFQPNFSRPFNYLNLVAQNAVTQERKHGFGQPRYTHLY